MIDLDANRVRGDRDEIEGKGSTASGTHIAWTQWQQQGKK